MPSVIVLSSSPARIFARSPTEVTFSSSSVTAQISNDNTASISAFKSTSVARDGFPGSFTTARQILAPKSSAENVPLGSVSSPKFKLTPPRPSSLNLVRPSSTIGLVAPVTEQPQERVGAEVIFDWDQMPDHTVINVLSSDARKKKEKRRVDHVAPLHLDKATTRKKHRTPSKQTAGSETRTLDNEAGFGLNLAQSFGHNQNETAVEKIANAPDGAITKRRKISLAPARSATPSSKGAVAVKSVGTKVTKTRSKSPTKKPLTITGLATSHYFEEGQQQFTPMMQYLVSTQAKLSGEADPETFETRVAKKRSAKGSKSRPKSRLKSPTTALRLSDSQEIIFATASQLARDESPALLRDIVEATKQSEEEVLSNPISTQETVAFWTEATTPQKTGTALFRSKKSLWSAHARDADDALLHMDDLLNQLTRKNVFAGKDALLEHSATIPVIDEPVDSIALLKNLKPDVTTYDIDDVTTPPSINLKNRLTITQTRSYSTASDSFTSKRMKDEVERCEDELQEEPGTADQNLINNNPILKPNYNSWTDEQLKVKVKERGFKRLRARKTMIDRLDECWAEEHGLDPTTVKAATKRAATSSKVLQPGDILGSVHGLAARLVPKVRKQRRPRGSPKKKGIEVQSAPARSRTSDIIDLSDIENSTMTAFDRLAAIQIPPDNVGEESDIDEDNAVHDNLEPSTAPVRGTGVRAIGKARIKSNAKEKQCPLTPPPTLTVLIQSSSPAFDELRSQSPPPPLAGSVCNAISPSAATFVSSPTGPEIDIGSQILAALRKSPSDNASRNHQTNPTWHEKILMYDPIVLEDLTVWLNTEGLNAIGEDREIDIMDVRNWCHAKGICCLWKGGWRGNKKKGKIEE